MSRITLTNPHAPGGSFPDARIIQATLFPVDGTAMVTVQFGKDNGGVWEPSGDATKIFTIPASDLTAALGAAGNNWESQTTTWLEANQSAYDGSVVP